MWNPQKRRCENQAMSLVEKIKQVFGDFDVVTFLDQHNVKYDEWLKSQIFQLLGAVEEDVLKIVEEQQQKLKELADLLKKIEPRDHQLEDPYYFQLILTKEEKKKFVEVFGESK